MEAIAKGVKAKVKKYKNSFQNITSKILIMLCMFLLVTSCGSQFSDRSLKTNSFNVSESKVRTTQELPHSDLTGIYSGIEDIYDDSDYVVSGVVKDIKYFEVQYVLIRKINILVNKSYKGNILKNTLISILENDGYLRLKSLYEAAKKEYEEKNGDKKKEDAWLYAVTYMSDKEDIENDMLIKYTYINKEDSKIGDELLLFLTDSSDDTYKDKKVKLPLGNKLSYPKGAYVPLGLFMGKFTKIDDCYKRSNMYSITNLIENNIGKSQSITESYTVKDVEDELNKLQ